MLEFIHDLFITDLRLYFYDFCFQKKIKEKYSQTFMVYVLDLLYFLFYVVDALIKRELKNYRKILSKSNDKNWEPYYFFCSAVILSVINFFILDT